jgi:hypothetical protein
MNLTKIYEQSIVENNKPKMNFWASDHDKDKFEIYHNFKGTPPTNPNDINTLKRFTVQKGVELALVDTFKDIRMSDDEAKSYGYTKSPDGQWHMEMIRAGIKVTGKPDLLLTGGIPVEIKTFYHDYQKQDLDKGIPHLNYVKQLATYMEFMSAPKGILFIHQIVTTAGAEVGVYEFEVLHIKDRIYKCGTIEFNLDDDYNRFAMIYNDYVLKDIEPESDFIYKYDLKDINWADLSRDKIGKLARNEAVFGDWQVQYSSYKNMIVAKQGQTLGYTSQELEYIQKINNYTPRKK